MKFCTKCGAELVDDAVICTKCGCIAEFRPIIAPNAPKAIDAQSPQLRQPACITAEKEQLLLPTFNFVSSVTSAIALFFTVLSTILGRVSSYLSTSIYSKTPNVYSYFWLDFELIIACIITSSIAFVCGLVFFILTLVKKQRGEKLFSGITKLVVGCLLLLASIIASVQ